MIGARGRGPLALLPVQDIATNGDQLVATSRTPWLRIDGDVSVYAGKWIAMVYDASICEALTRPVMRCHLAEGHIDMMMPAPVFGRGVWLGKLPEGLREIWISPVDRPGPFRFRLDSIDTLRAARRMLRGLRIRPGLALLSIWAGLNGDRRRAEMRSRNALLSPLSDYRAWRLALTRPFEWFGIDTPEMGASRHFTLLASGGADHADTVAQRLRGQPCRDFSVVPVAADAPLAELLADCPEDSLVAVIAPEDVLATEALVVVSAAAHRNAADVYYADEEGFGGDRPRFKPEWSPVLAQSLDLPGRAWFARAGWLRRHLGDTRIAQIGPLKLDQSDTAVHVSRILLTTRNDPRPMVAVAAPAVAGVRPSATLIIPTRDRVDLLTSCIESIRRTDLHEGTEIIIVDNDSQDQATHTYFNALAGAADVRILNAPGRFNFSALCNAAANEARGQALVFINNDVEAQSSDWLDHMLSWAMQPHIGAVGAKLQYPDQTVQHAGVVLGLGGCAGHFERGVQLDDPGCFDRLCVPHEISAVTAACMAVEKRKFDAVGGFDAVHLPVDLSDIDLCLRLSEKGWKTLLEPRAVLVHRESASRGRSTPAEERYGEEIAWFKQRWHHNLRRDPYFHPALSLSRLEPALG